MSKQTITVVEDNNPVISVSVWSKNGNYREAYSLDDASAVEFFVKADADATDPSPQYTVSNGKIIVDATPDTNRCEVRVATAETVTAGTYYYHLDVVKNGSRVTVMHGDFVVLNN